LGKKKGPAFNDVGRLGLRSEVAQGSRDLGEYEQKVTKATSNVRIKRGRGQRAARKGTETPRNLSRKITVRRPFERHEYRDGGYPRRGDRVAREQLTSQLQKDPPKKKKGRRKGCGEGGECWVQTKVSMQHQVEVLLSRRELRKKIERDEGEVRGTGWYSDLCNNGPREKSLKATKEEEKTNKRTAF